MGCSSVSEAFKEVGGAEIDSRLVMEEVSQELSMGYVPYHHKVVTPTGKVYTAYLQKALNQLVNSWAGD